MQLPKESLKQSGLLGFEPWPPRYRCSALTNWAIKPTGSWSLNWFVIYPGKMKKKLWIYEIHIFELQNEEINVKKILAVINATYAVAKRKPEKIRLAGIRTLTSAIPVQRSNQLSYQANWELVIKLVRNIPGKDEDEIMNIWNSCIWTVEWRNNVKKILAVINATYAVAKRKPEKIRLAGIWTLTSAIPVECSNQLSYQANWELVIKLVRNIPGKDEDEIMNIWNSYSWTAEWRNKCKEDPRSY